MKWLPESTASRQAPDAEAEHSFRQTRYHCSSLLDGLEAACFKEILERFVLMKDVIMFQSTVNEDGAGPGKFAYFHFRFRASQNGHPLAFQQRHHLLCFLLRAAVLRVNVEQPPIAFLEPAQKFVCLGIQRVEKPNLCDMFCQTTMIKD